MKMKTNMIVVYFCVSVSIVILLSAMVLRKDTLGPSMTGLDFPFEIIYERRTEGVGAPMWTVTVILSRPYYSRENLDSLFFFLSRKHPGKDERLQVRVYTDKSKLGIPGTPRISELEPLSDAMFSRQGDFDGTAGRNAWYHYSPDPEKPDERKTVVLKGKDPYSRRNIVQTWEAQSNLLKIRVTAYELKQVEPPNMFYTFESYVEGLNRWREIMTVVQEEQSAIPTDQLRVASDEITYLFLGWMYAVTTDGGRTWSIWDAQEELPGWRCCNYRLIEDVHIRPDGEGTMKFSEIAGQGKVSELHTKDYGRHWSLEYGNR